MSLAGFGLVLAIMDLLVVFVAPLRLALNQSLGHHWNFEEIRASIVSAREFKIAVAWKVAASVLALLLFMLVPTVAYILAVISYLGFSAVLFKLTWSQ